MKIRVAFFSLFAMFQSAIAQTPVKLNILWSVLPTGTDRMTTTGGTEITTFPIEGQLYYIPASSLAGSIPFYRLYRNPDHMDSDLYGEAGYVTEFTEGYPWDSPYAPDATYEICRSVKPSNGDHATLQRNPSNPSLNILPSGYNEECFFDLYGYPRFSTATNDQYLLSLSAGGVTIKSNKIAGGALWEWNWNGKQFINDSDYGRQIQTSLWPNGTVDDGTNPTEAGDSYSFPSLSPARRHGSPNFVFHNDGTTQVTRAIPLDFFPEDFGGTIDNPVIWPDMSIGKNIQLNFNSMGSVAKYTTVVYTGHFISNALIEIPTGYVKSEFDKLYKYDAQSDVMASVNLSDCTGWYHYDTFDYGGVITSNIAGSYAIGIYGAKNYVGGSVARLELNNFKCDGDGSGQYKRDTIRWAATVNQNLFPGTYYFNTWIVSGTLNDVKSKMRALYLAGFK